MAERGWAFCQDPSKRREDCQGNINNFFFFLAAALSRQSPAPTTEQPVGTWQCGMTTAFLLLLPEARLAVKPHQGHRAGSPELLYTHDWGLCLPSNKWPDLVAAGPWEVSSTQSSVWAEVAPSELSAVAVLHSPWRGN